MTSREEQVGFTEGSPSGNAVPGTKEPKPAAKASNNQPGPERIIDAPNIDGVKALAMIILVIYVSGSGQLGKLINCSIQRIIQRHTWSRHLLLILSIFLVRGLPIFESSTRDTSLAEVWLFTLVVYAAFIIATKSKWFFVLPALALLFLSENVRDRDEAFVSSVDKISHIMLIVACVLMLVGFVHYLIVKMRTKGRRFSLYAFWFGTDAACGSSTDADKERREDRDIPRTSANWDE
jgi:hypothetical protein